MTKNTLFIHSHQIERSALFVSLSLNILKDDETRERTNKRKQNACNQTWLMTMTCNCNDGRNHRTCEKKKSQSDYFTTTCIPMKPIHWKHSLIWGSWFIQTSDSLKWLSWIGALHIPCFLQWLNESTWSCKQNIMTRKNLWSLFIPCRTRKDSKHILTNKQKENSVSTFWKRCSRFDLSW